MRIDIVTIFPEMFHGVFDHGVVGRARRNGIVRIHLHDLRDWTKDRHRSTDDAPYGGGPGMVMKIEPLVAAVEAIASEGSEGSRKIVLLSPRGTPLRQAMISGLVSSERLVLVAGRYEGVDERFRQAVGAEEISIGDYVLSGGEIPAMVVVDAVVRLLPGTMSDPRSAQEDSFSAGVLDHPHYTRPAEFRGLRVPEVLLSGNHAEVRDWRRRRALEDTKSRRPELLTNGDL
ncbi:MAG TPA: tRNA (guanosine(37)-N1)-methyltransferase TrmD [Vicinamibacteria bacterium]|nr:tRNA (guanosine(37)-N1)-methyltransferase TrmD [Vicinamibacteria bacterium]